MCGIVCMCVCACCDCYQGKWEVSPYHPLPCPTFVQLPVIVTQLQAVFHSQKTFIHIISSEICNKQWSGLTTPFFRWRSRGSWARAVPNHSSPPFFLFSLCLSQRRATAPSVCAERETMVSVFSPVFFSGLASGADHGYGVWEITLFAQNGKSFAKLAQRSFHFPHWKW